MKPWLSSTLLFLAALLFVFGLGGFLLLRILNYFPSPQEPAELHTDASAATPLSIGAQTVRILCWNIQYSASRNYHFFYEGGKAVVPDKKDVEATLASINRVVKKYDPDIILWQEVDRDSTRTHRIDQLKRFLQANPYPSWAATPYHKSAYIPTPGHQHMKRVNMQLAVFSKFTIKRATRYALPLLQESFLRRAFNLKRAVLEVEIPLKQGGSLLLMNTHLSAFSKNDGTMKRQIKKLMELTNAAERSGKPWFIGGDFNLLPPGVAPSTLGKKEAAYYSSLQNNPIQPMFEKWRSGLTLEAYKKNPSLYNTYLPYQASQADRWIDYIFTGSKASVVTYKVLSQYTSISDHLPILIELELKK